MRALIAVTWFDTKENRRSDATRHTLDILRGQVRSPHLIIGVDNGSTDKSALKDATRLCDHLIVLDQPRSIAYGVNSAWHLYEDEILAGKTVAVKHDSDINVQQENWLDVLLDLVEKHPDIGLIGPRFKRQEYNNNWWVLEDHDKWFESQFLYGAMAMRTPSGFRAIGYAWNPYGRWGWQDHYDCRRIRENTSLKVAVVKDLVFEERVGRSALPESHKEAIRESGRINLQVRLAQIRNGMYPLFERFVP